ncbi:HlyD family secretion protein [Propionivibrio dicarboxylicus]|uniref:Membrane fusion protein n=1 Tax=Propionivibrio dicarboxylicus TaxID=83767 RepID=A0A1G8LPW0_9RHOO|nr:HlyD family efflux transporter periplasmic adaptor subunit [Propionivibrio dicarboxylicus]SDI57751.1 membrane fusion protein [Propionivibrio dicarboxylicus]
MPTNTSLRNSRFSAEKASAQDDPWRSAPVLGAPKPSQTVIRGTIDALFRHEAIATRQQSWLGETLIARPLATDALTIAALSIATLVVLFLVFGEYTRKERVAGEVQTSLGVAKVAPPVNGVVTRRMVSDGQCVNAGDPLFVISADRSTAKGNTQEAILARIAEQKNALAAEYRKQKDVFAEEAAELTRKIGQTKQQLEEIRQALQLQERRAGLASDIVEQYRLLVQKKYFSITAQYEKERELLDAQRLLSDLRRQETGLQRDIGTLQSDLRNHPLRSENKLSAMERQIQALDQSGADAEGKREIVIPAPQTGCVTAILAQPGYTVVPDKPMAALLPRGAKLEAHLYAPSRAIGFIREGTPVLLRYEAYPYQKFGQYGGKVLEVARAAIPSTELPFQMTSEEAMYRIRIDLDAPAVVAYGKSEPLQAGMRLEADILIDTRKLYEWVFEPIYSLSGKV